MTTAVPQRWTRHPIVFRMARVRGRGYADTADRIPAARTKFATLAHASPAHAALFFVLASAGGVLAKPRDNRGRETRAPRRRREAWHDGRRV